MMDALAKVKEDTIKQHKPEFPGSLYKDQLYTKHSIYVHITLRTNTSETNQQHNALFQELQHPTSVACPTSSPTATYICRMLFMQATKITVPHNAHYHPIIEYILLHTVVRSSLIVLIPPQHIVLNNVNTE